MPRQILARSSRDDDVNLVFSDKFLEDDAGTSGMPHSLADHTIENTHLGRLPCSTLGDETPTAGRALDRPGKGGKPR